MDRTSQDPRRAASQQASVLAVRAVLGALLVIAAGGALLAVCSLWIAPLRVLGDERHAGSTMGAVLVLVPLLTLVRMLRGRHAGR